MPAASPPAGCPGDGGQEDGLSRQHSYFRALAIPFVVILLPVIIVGTVGMMLVNAVDDDPQELLLREFSAGSLGQIEGRRTRINQHQNPIAEPRQQSGVGYGNGGRRVKNDPVKKRGHLLQEGLKTAIAEE